MNNIPIKFYLQGTIYIDRAADLHISIHTMCQLI